MEVIKTAEKNPGSHVRSLAEQFKCGKTQIEILKKKDSIMSMYEANNYI